MSGDIEMKHIYYKPLSHSDDQLSVIPGFGHILVTVTIELQMEQALLTVESPVNTGKIWWARLDLNQRPLPCEGSAFYCS